MRQSLLVYNACPQPQTEATVLVSPSLLQIDTFGKWCRCLHNVCCVKLKKCRYRYLDKCRLSAPAGNTDTEFTKPHIVLPEAKSKISGKGVYLFAHLVRTIMTADNVSTTSSSTKHQV